MKNTKEKLLNYILERKMLLEKALSKASHSNKPIDEAMIPTVEHRLKLTKKEFIDINALYDLIEYLECRIKIAPLTVEKQILGEVLDYIKMLMNKNV